MGTIRDPQREHAGRQSSGSHLVMRSVSILHVPTGSTDSTRGSLHATPKKQRLGEVSQPAQAHSRANPQHLPVWQTLALPPLQELGQGSHLAHLVVPEATPRDTLTGTLENMEGAGFSSLPICLSLKAEQMRWHADCAVWIEILQRRPRDRMKRDISHRSLSEHGQMAKNTTVSPGRVGTGQSVRGGGKRSQAPRRATAAALEATHSHSPSFRRWRGAGSQSSEWAAQIPALWGPQDTCLELAEIIALNLQAQLPLPVTQTEIERWGGGLWGRDVKCHSERRELGPVRDACPA